MIVSRVLSARPGFDLAAVFSWVVEVFKTGASPQDQTINYSLRGPKDTPCASFEKPPSVREDWTTTDVGSSSIAASRTEEMGIMRASLS